MSPMIRPNTVRSSTVCLSSLNTDTLGYSQHFPVFACILAKKGIKVDDLHEAMQDPKIVLLLEDQFREILNPTVQALYKEFVDEFSSNLEVLVAKSAAALVKTYHDPQSTRLLKLEAENVQLKSKFIL